ncbi:SAM-dependent methyltransferase [Geodermatophilus sp. SYSU D00708]
MAADALMTRAVELGVATDALAALAAHVRIETEGLPADPAVRAVLADVAAELLGGNAVAPVPAAQVVGLARTWLRQAVDLVDDPGRSGGWDRVDERLLQSIGRLSMGIAGAVRAAEPALPGLAEALARPGSTLLDVGTGTGWLAIALAQAYPHLHVTGIDLFEPALDLAKVNRADAGLTDRIDLRLQDAAALDETEAYDVVWLPMPFLRRGLVPEVLEAACRALRPGGWLLAGTFAGGPDRLGQLLTDLRTVRSGGHPWQPAELLDLLRDAGLSDVAEVPRSWAAPVRLYAGRH